VVCLSNSDSLPAEGGGSNSNHGIFHEVGSVSGPTAYLGGGVALVLIPENRARASNFLWRPCGPQLLKLCGPLFYLGCSDAFPQLRIGSEPIPVILGAARSELWQTTSACNLNLLSLTLKLQKYIELRALKNVRLRALMNLLSWLNDYRGGAEGCRRAV